jgi:hypothetical protein
MNAILYLPDQTPQALDATAFTTEPTDDQTAMAADALECGQEFVDVLASGAGYIIYTVFDSEADVNPQGMKAAGVLTGVEFDPEDEDQVLRGPVLTVSA